MTTVWKAKTHFNPEAQIEPSKGVGICGTKGDVSSDLKKMTCSNCERVFGHWSNAIMTASMEKRKEGRE